MAGNTSSIIGALRVVLGADTAQFSTALNAARGQLKQFSVQAVALGTLISDALTKALNSAADGIRQALDDIAKTSKLSSALGVPTEQLSALKYAAQQVGMSFDQLGDGMKSLGQKMAEAIADPAGTTARAFKALGVSAVDATGKLRPIADVMNELAAKFASFTGGAGKLRLADELGVTDLLPLLNKGRDGIAALTDEAAKLGVVIDAKTASAAKDFNANLVKLQTSSQVLWTQLAGALAPALSQIAQTFLDASREGQSSIVSFEGLNLVLKALVITGSTVSAVFKYLKAIIGTVAASLVSVADGEFAKAWENIKEGGATAAANFQADADRINAAWDGASKGAGRFAVEGLGQVIKGMAPIIASNKAMQQGFKSARIELQGIIDSPVLTIAEKMLAVQKAFEAGKIKVDDFNAATMKLQNEGIKKSLDDMKLSLNDMLALPIENMADAIGKVKDAFAAGAITAREFANANKKIGDNIQAQYEGLGSAISTTLTAVFAKSKAAAIASVIIDTGVAMMKAWSQGGMFAGPMVALIAAQGAARLATIKSTNLGSGGSTPSASADTASTAAAGPMQQQSLLVQGIRANDLFSGDMVRGLAEKLLAFQRDGGVVVLE